MCVCVCTCARVCEAAVHLWLERPLADQKWLPVRCQTAAIVSLKANAKLLEMQQYIDISPYRDTLGGDTVSIHI